MPGRLQFFNHISRSFFDFLLFSNLFIALCAVAQALVTYRLLHAEPDNFVLGFLFFSTLAQYNFSILVSKPSHPGRSPFRRIRWFFGHHRLIISLTIIAAISIVPLLFFLSIPSKIVVLFLGAAAVTYNLPVFSMGGKRFGLRNIPGIKLFLIALVWSASCVLIPILELESHHLLFVSPVDTLLLIAKRFLLIAAITVPFDIRDLFGDTLHDLKTIPVIFGERKAYQFCLCLLFAYLVLLFLFNPVFDLNFAGLTLTILVTGWLIFKSTAKKNEYYYFLYLDGIMILQYIMLVICNFIGARH